MNRLFIFILLLCIYPNIWADDDLLSKKNEIKIVKQTLSQKESQIQQELEQLKKLEVLIGNIAKKNYQIKENLIKKKLEQQKIEEEIKQLQLLHANTLNALTNHIRIIDKLSRTNPLKLFFEQKIFTSQQTFATFKYLTTHQKNTFDHIKKELKIFQEKSSMLYSIIQEIEKLDQDQQQEHQQLTQQLQQRKKLIDNWQKEQGKHHQLLALLERDAALLEQKTLSENIEQSPKSNFIYRFSWPLATTDNQVPKVHLLTTNRYILKIPSGLPVKAIYPGKVIFADWLRGFGLMIIVDHGKDYMSLYGHNQSLFKTIGDEVQKGEIIALSGDSGGQREPGLYFEVRRKGKSVNLERWFR